MPDPVVAEVTLIGQNSIHGSQPLEAPVTQVEIETKKGKNNRGESRVLRNRAFDATHRRCGSPPASFIEGVGVVTDQKHPSNRDPRGSVSPELVAESCQPRLIPATCSA